MARVERTRPHVVLLGGPNGAGKSTAAPSLLKGTLRVEEFVNADIIAQGISGFKPDGAALQAGRVMMMRLKALAEKRVDFAFETTLASRTFAPWIRRLLSQGYAFSLGLFSAAPTCGPGRDHPAAFRGGAPELLRDLSPACNRIGVLRQREQAWSAPRSARTR